ncbi:MAG: hypothetical protein HQ556_01735 [Candidatus Marinimicrobia bacterium]|nr:hypothetical protein [Candidatus Neomarinimicrobiota bacterium]
MKNKKNRRMLFYKKGIDMHKILVVLYTLLLPMMFNACSVKSDQGDGVDQETNREIYKQVIQLATKYNSDIQWLTFAEDTVFFTIELQRALFNHTDRSRLVIGSIVDIMKQNNKFLLTAVDWQYGIDYQLQCNEQQVEYILNISKVNSQTFEVYAIIINPESIHKPAVKLVDEMGGDDSYVTYDISDIIVVKGICLDVVSIGDDSVEIEELLKSLAAKDQVDAQNEE